MSIDIIVREGRRLRKHLRDLTLQVSGYLAFMDEEMRRPSDAERGKRIALLLNKLEYANDQARYFGLGLDFRKDSKKRKATEAKAGARLAAALAAPEGR